jgi:uncharacterized protein with HEPN domain
MNTNPRDNRYLWHMFEHATHALYVVMGLDLETYQESIQARLAAERGLDIFSRAAARLSQAFKQSHGEIPWQRIAMVAATLDYPDAAPDHALVWGFLRRDLPRIMEHLEPLIGGNREPAGSPPDP